MLFRSACAGAEAVLDYIKEHELVERSRRMGALLLEKLKVLEKYSVVGNIRGIGLLLGIEFVKNKETKEPLDFNFSAEIGKYCFPRGLMLSAGVTGAADGVVGDALQLAPPLIISEEEIDIVISMLDEAIRYVMAAHGLQ